MATVGRTRIFFALLLFSGLILAVGLILAGGPAPAGAENTNTSSTLQTRAGTITITAEQMSFSRTEGRILFSGNVKVVKNGYTMQADQVTVTLDDGEDTHSSRNIRSMVARHNVRFTFGDRIATAGRAEYDPKAETVVLTEAPRVEDKGMEVTGKRIIIDLATQESTVEGGAFTFTEDS